MRSEKEQSAVFCIISPCLYKKRETFSSPALLYHRNKQASSSQNSINTTRTLRTKQANHSHKRRPKITNHQTRPHTHKILLRPMSTQQAKPSPQQPRPSNIKHIHRPSRRPRPVSKSIGRPHHIISRRTASSVPKCQRGPEKNQRRNAHHGILRPSRGVCVWSTA